MSHIPGQGCPPPPAWANFLIKMFEAKFLLTKVYANFFQHFFGEFVSVHFASRLKRINLPLPVKKDFSLQRTVITFHLCLKEERRALEGAMDLLWTLRNNFRKKMKCRLDSS